MDSKLESTELQKEITSEILSGESDGVDYVYMGDHEAVSCHID